MRPVKFSFQSSHPPEMVFHSHPLYEIFYFHEGRCNYIIGPHVYSLQPGDLILMHGMTLHRPNPDLRYPYIRSIIHFEPQFLLEYMNKTYMSPLLKPFEELRNFILRAGPMKEEIELLFATMSHFHNRADEHHFQRFMLRFVDLLYIMKDLSSLPLQSTYLPTTDRERHVQNVIQYVELHYSEDFTMIDLEHELHVSRHYLSRLFKAWTGSTIYQFLYHRRINQAKTLFLIEHDLTVSEVSARVGFKHLPHFSRVFKLYEGCNPEQYRKRIAQIAEQEVI
jgi:AraC-like DNA-binding protein